MLYEFFFSVLLFIVVFPASGWGSELRLLPSFDLKEEYNSNIMFAAAGRDIRTDFLTTASPGFEAVHNTGRIESSLSTRIEHIKFLYHRELNSTDQSYRGNVDYSFSERSKLSVETAYVKDSRPDRDIKKTGIVLSVTPRHSLRSELSAEYRLTEKMALVASGNFAENRFKNQKELDDTSREGTAGLIVDFGKYVSLLTGRMDWGYSDYSATGSGISTLRGQIGFSLEVNEFWSVLVNGGFRKTWSEVSVSRQEPLLEIISGVPTQIGTQLVDDQVNKTGWGWVGVTSVSYRGEHGHLDFSFNRNVQPAVGLGGAVERDSLTVSTRYRGNHETTFLFSADYYINTSRATSFSAQEIDRRSFNVRQGMSYSFSKDMGVDASYEYVEERNRVSDLKAARHLFSVRFQIRHDFFM